MFYTMMMMDIRLNNTTGDGGEEGLNLLPYYIYFIRTLVLTENDMSGAVMFLLCFLSFSVRYRFRNGFQCDGRLFLVEDNCFNEGSAGFYV